MNFKLKYIKLLLIISVFNSYLLHASDGTDNSSWYEFGIPYFRNYTPKEHGGHFQNWSIVQDSRGVILVANNYGLLEYDGVNWRLYSGSDASLRSLRSLAVDKSGTIYCGTGNQFGYLSQDENGDIKFISLLDRLDEKKYYFNDVWYTLVLDNTVYFATHQYIFRWHNEKLTVTETSNPENIFHTAFAVQNQFFIRQKQVGLLRMEGNLLKPIPGGEIFAERAIYMMEPYNDSSILIGTSGDGFYLFDGKTFEQFPTSLDAYLKKNHLYCGTRLSIDYYALGTRVGGIAIMDRDGNLLKIFDNTQGLQDNSVWDIYRDVQGNLWLALNNGVCKVELPSPISIFTKENGLDGIIEKIVRHKNRLYVATNLGIFYLDNVINKQGWKAPQFKKVSGVTEYGWWLTSHENALLAGTTGGVYEIRENRARQIPGSWASVFEILTSRYHENLFFLAERTGVGLLKRNGGVWIAENHIPVLDEKVYHLVEEAPNILWAESANDEVIRVEMLSESKFPFSTPSIQISKFDTSHGLPGGRVYPILINDQLKFSTAHGLYKYDETIQYFKKLPSENLQKIWAFLGAVDRRGRLWISGYGKKGESEQIFVGLPQDDGSFAWDANSYLDLPEISYVNTIYPENEHLTWFGTSEGLIRYDNRFRSKDTPQLFTQIRRVLSMKGDSLIYNGFKQSSMPELGYDKNNLRFEFALANFKREDRNKYQTYLEGFDDDWTNWSRESHRDFTNLPHGNFVFKVRSKSFHNTKGKEASFSFSILAPWYKTWWAYFGYFLALIFLIMGVDRVQRKRLIKREQQRARLREAEIIEEKNVELSEKNTQLQNALETVKKTQSELQRSELRFRSVVQSAHEAIISADEKGNIIFWNKHAEMVFGYSKEEVMGKPLTILMPARHHKAHLTGMNRFIQKGEKKIVGKVLELEALRKDGTEFPIELTVASWEVADGKFVTGMIRDITERKQNQEALERTQKQLFQSEKMVTIGKLTGGITHEMNNPVGAIKASADTNIRCIDKIEQIFTGEDSSIHKNSEYLKLMQMLRENTKLTSIAGERIARTIESLKKFTRLDEAEIQVIDIHESIETTLTLIEHEIDDQVKVVKKYGDVPPIECYASELNQVLMNLLTNSIHSISDYGTITVCTSSNNQSAILKIADTGAGIPPGALRELFKPGFSRKGGRVKIGLGLFAVHNTIEKHGGKIEVQSEIGKGTTFTISLPLKLSSKTSH